MLQFYQRLEDNACSCTCGMCFGVLLQLNIDFRMHFPQAVTGFTDRFPEWAPGILAAARMSRKVGITELLRDYDAQQHSTDLTMRDHMYAILALLHLLPSCNTRHNAKSSSAELQNCVVTFRPQQTSLDEFIKSEESWA